MFGKKPKLKPVTIVHTSPTEPVRLPDGENGPPLVVHPTAVRSKLPFRKKVREKKRSSKGGAAATDSPGCGPDDQPVAHNVNNNNSPVEAKKKPKKRACETKAAHPKQSKSNHKKPVKKDTVVVATPRAAGATSLKTNPTTPGEDPLGKVRNWLLQSHNMEPAQFGSLKKSKSSPAGIDLAAAPHNAAPGAKRTAWAGGVVPVVSPASPLDPPETKKKKPSKDMPQVKLQVVYKPPFKFSVKLGRSKNEVSSQLIRDKRPEAVKHKPQQAAVKSDRVRPKISAAAAAAAATSSNPIAEDKPQRSPTKMRKLDTVAIPDESKARKVEFQRSVSAPQPAIAEPLYQNTFGNAAGADTGAQAAEPVYANARPPETKNNPAAADVGGRGRVRGSGSQNHKPSVGKSKRSPSSSSRTVRRNSWCDLGSATGHLPMEMVVKRRQLSSDDPVGDRPHPGRAGAGSHSAKPVRLKCSAYDVENASVMTPSIAKSPKRGRADEGPNPKDHQSRPSVRRCVSNTSNQRELNQFKRYSLQHLDSKLSHSLSQDKQLNVLGPGPPRAQAAPTIVDRDFVDTILAAAAHQQPDVSSEIPSDLEGLLSEGEK